MRFLIDGLERILLAVFPEQRVLQRLTIALVLIMVAATISGLLSLTILPMAVAIGAGPFVVALGLVFYWIRRMLTR